MKGIKEVVKEIVKKEAGGIAYSFDVIIAKTSNGQIEASNDLSKNQIVIYISPSLKLDQRSKDYFSDYGYNSDEDRLIKIVADMARHEIGHWEYPSGSGYGCPYDLFKAEEIYEAVRRKLPSHLKEASGYVSNAFMDIIDNTNVAYHLQKRKNEHFAGEVWFYYDQGTQNNGYSPFYDWFIRIQEDLWMNNRDKEFLSHYHNQDSSIQQLIEELEEEFFVRLGLTKGNYNLDILMDKEEWKHQASVFAELAAKLLEIGLPVEILTSGEKYGDKCWLDKKIEDPNFIQKVIRKRLEKGEPLPSYLDKRKMLSMLYRELAKDIPIIAEFPTENYSFPIVGYGRKESDGVTRRIGINENGEIVFYEPKYHWSMSIPIKKGIGGIPNLYFILDSSGSMTSFKGKEIPGVGWGDKSRYHYALLGIYGIMNYLERMNIRPSKIAITSFSNTSRSIIAESFEKIEEILFSPEAGGTLINSKEIKRVAKILGKSVIIMLSDGEIHNWDEVKEDIKEVMRNNYSAFISIGVKSSPYYDLRGVAKVFFVERDEDLPRIMIDFTRKSYSN